MKVSEVILQRRTVHNYTPDIKISESEIRSALECALAAPNHKFTFPWKFAIVGPEVRQKISEIALKMKDTSDPEEIKRVEGKLLNPSGLVMFLQKKCDDAFQSKEDYATIACSIQNFTLALAENGWDTKWSTGKLTRSDETLAAVGVDSSEFESCGFVWIGKRCNEPAPRRRPNLEDLIVVTK